MLWADEPEEEEPPSKAVVGGTALTKAPEHATRIRERCGMLRRVFGEEEIRPVSLLMLFQQHSPSSLTCQIRIRSGIQIQIQTARYRPSRPGQRWRWTTAKEAVDPRRLATCIVRPKTRLALLILASRVRVGSVFCIPPEDLGRQLYTLDERKL